jgi:hypothetical protein
MLSAAGKSIRPEPASAPAASSKGTAGIGKPQLLDQHPTEKQSIAVPKQKLDGFVHERAA